MDRLELIRIETDKIIQKLANEENRKFAYLHSYGVSQCAIYLATVRKLDVELAGLAKSILEESKLFKEDEIIAITSAIATHSDKMSRTDSRFAEMLKDSDVLQHYLYNPNIELQEKDRYRLYYLLEDLKKMHQKGEAS